MNSFIIGGRIITLPDRDGDFSTIVIIFCAVILTTKSQRPSGNTRHQSSKTNQPTDRATASFLLLIHCQSHWCCQTRASEQTTEHVLGVW